MRIQPLLEVRAKQPDALVQCALLANSAGIGGGPFYVPLLNVVLGFDLKAATALSHTIVGEAAVGMPQSCRAHDTSALSAD